MASWTWVIRKRCPSGRSRRGDPLRRIAQGDNASHLLRQPPPDCAAIRHRDAYHSVDPAGEHPSAQNTIAAMDCPKCGYHLDPLGTFCPRCAQLGAPHEIVCPVCQAPNDFRLTYCQACHGPLAVDRQEGWARFPRSSLESRFVAHALDAVVVALAQSLLLIVLLAATLLVAPGRRILSSAPLSFADWRLLLIVGFAYHSVLIGRTGQTVGKRLCALAVVGRDGAPPGIGRGAMRAAAQLASLATLGLIFLWVVWDRDHRGLHDRIADTAVVRRGGVHASTIR